MGKHKCFISFSKSDQSEASEFIKKFGQGEQVFIYRSAPEMFQSIIDSDDDSYVLRRVRELYLTDSTVTIALVGKRAWAEKYIDWEVMSSLRDDPKIGRSGLLAITLPSAANSSIKKLPDRIADNILGSKGDEGYARWKKYPSSAAILESWIEDAFDARNERSNLLKNGRSRKLIDEAFGPKRSYARVS